MTVRTIEMLGLTLRHSPGLDHTYTARVGALVVQAEDRCAARDYATLTIAEYRERRNGERALHVVESNLAACERSMEVAIRRFREGLDRL